MERFVPKKPDEPVIPVTLPIQVIEDIGDHTTSLSFTAGAVCFYCKNLLENDFMAFYGQPPGGIGYRIYIHIDQCLDKAIKESLIHVMKVR